MKSFGITAALAAIACSNSFTAVKSFSLSTKSVSTLLKENAERIDKLEKIAFDFENPPTDRIFYLRYALKEDEEEMEEQLKTTLAWRQGEGKEICASATAAINLAMSSDDGWNNAPVRDMAPHAKTINNFITSSQCLTTTINSGDLCYCIRAGQIDDVGLMSAVTLEQMTDFFLYCKEVNSIVANMRSSPDESDRLVSVLTANDLAGVKLVGGDATFRKALSAASTKANDLYPNLAGPTFLLNLPRLLGALVKLFTPLFPVEVRKRLKFESGPLKNVSELLEISTDADKRALFLGQIDAVLEK